VRTLVYTILLETSYGDYTAKVRAEDEATAICNIMHYFNEGQLVLHAEGEYNLLPELGAVIIVRTEPDNTHNVISVKKVKDVSEQQV